MLGKFIFIYLLKSATTTLCSVYLYTKKIIRSRRERALWHRAASYFTIIHWSTHGWIFSSRMHIQHHTPYNTFGFSEGLSFGWIISWNRRMYRLFHLLIYRLNSFGTYAFLTFTAFFKWLSFRFAIAFFLHVLL